MPHLIISYGPTGSRQDLLKNVYMSFLQKKLSIDLTNISVIDVDQSVIAEKDYIERSISTLCQFFEECAVNRESEKSVAAYMDTLLDNWTVDCPCTATDLAQKLENVYLEQLQGFDQQTAEAIQLAIRKKQNIFISMIGKQPLSLPITNELASRMCNGVYYSVTVFLDAVQHTDRLQLDFKSAILNSYSCLKRCYKNLQTRNFGEAMTCVNAMEQYIPPRLPTKNEMEFVQHSVAAGLLLFKHCVLVNSTSDTQPVLVDVNDARLPDFMRAVSLGTELSAAITRNKKRSRSGEETKEVPKKVRTSKSEAEQQEKFIASARQYLLDNKIDGVQKVAWLQKDDCDIFIIGEIHADHIRQDCDGTQEAIDKVITDCKDLDLIIEAHESKIEDKRRKEGSYAHPTNLLHKAKDHYSECMKRKNCSFRVHRADPTKVDQDNKKQAPEWLNLFYDTMQKERMPFLAGSKTLFDENDIPRLFTDNRLLQHEIDKTKDELGEPINKLFTRERLLQTFKQINELLMGKKNAIADQLKRLFSFLPGESQQLLSQMDLLVDKFQDWSAANREDRLIALMAELEEVGVRPVKPEIINLIFDTWERLRPKNEELINKVAEPYLFHIRDMLYESFLSWTAADEEVNRKTLVELIKKMFTLRAPYS